MEQVYKIVALAARVDWCRRATDCRCRRCRDAFPDRRSRGSRRCRRRVCAASRLPQVSRPGSPFFIGTRVKLPLHVAGFRIERLQEAGLIQIVAGADQDVIADHDRRHGGEILLVEIGDFFVPALLAGAWRRGKPDNRRAFPCTASCPTCPGRDCRCACRPWSSRSNATSRGRRARPRPRRCRASRNTECRSLRESTRGCWCRRRPPVPRVRAPSPPTMVGEAPPPPRPPPPGSRPGVTRLTQASVRFFTLD